MLVSLRTEWYKLGCVGRYTKEMGTFSCHAETIIPLVHSQLEVIVDLISAWPLVLLQSFSHILLPRSRREFSSLPGLRDAKGAKAST